MTHEQLPEHEDRCEVRIDGRRCRSVASLHYLAHGERARFCSQHWSEFITRSGDLRAGRGWGYCLAAVTVIQEMTGKTASTIGRG